MLTLNRYDNLLAIPSGSLVVGQECLIIESSEVYVWTGDSWAIKPSPAGFNVQTIEDRDALPEISRFNGMQVYVHETGITYYLTDAAFTNDDWRQFSYLEKEENLRVDTLSSFGEFEGMHVRYVSSADGYDGYDGLTEDEPFLTIKAAVESLPSYFNVAKIKLLPGDYPSLFTTSNKRGKTLIIEGSFQTHEFASIITQTPATDKFAENVWTLAAPLTDPLFAGGIPSSGQYFFTSSFIEEIQRPLASFVPLLENPSNEELQGLKNFFISPGSQIDGYIASTQTRFAQSFYLSGVSELILQYLEIPNGLGTTGITLSATNDITLRGCNISISNVSFAKVNLMPFGFNSQSLDKVTYLDIYNIGTNAYPRYTNSIVATGCTFTFFVTTNSQEALFTNCRFRRNLVVGANSATQNGSISYGLGSNCRLVNVDFYESGRIIGFNPATSIYIAGNVSVDHSALDNTFDFIVLHRGAKLTYLSGALLGIHSGSVRLLTGASLHNFKSGALDAFGDPVVDGLVPGENVIIGGLGSVSWADLPLNDLGLGPASQGCFAS